MKVDPQTDGDVASSRVPLRVLIVEDSEDDALLLLRELEKGAFGPEHERVDNPESMRRALAERGPWDVVLSDWRMPRFSATEALAVLREADPETPFIIVSGKVGEEAAVEAMRAGAHDYVMKGNFARLCATVERGLREAEARRERRRAEEERDRLFEFSLDLLGVVGLDGYFKRVNPAFEETLGYSSGELLARPFIEFVHPEDRAKSMSALEGLGRGERTAYFENRYLRKDGSVVWLEWKGVPVVEEDLIYATARDVTERKRAEEGLGRRDAILRAVAFAAERFLERVASWEENAQEVLERLGRAAEVSRVSILENHLGEDGEVRVTLSYEWAASGVSAQIDNPRMQGFPYRAAGYGRWMETLSGGGLIYGHTREFPESERPELEAQDILSIAVVPIFAEGEWWGQIGFDECFAEREWSAAEIDALKAATDTLGAAIQRERAEEALGRRDAILRAVAFAAERFLEKVASWEESAQEVLERLGAAAEASRAYIFESYPGEDGDVWLTQRYEWVAPGVSSQMDNPLMQAFPYRAAGYGRWVEFLIRGEPVHGLTREFEEDERPELEAQDILSIAIVPVFVEGKLWGVIGFDECTSEREWSIVEIDALKAAADTLGTAIQRERAEEAMRQSERLYRTVVEQATEYISLVDVETRRFVGSNPAFREALGYTEEELGHMTLYDVVAHDQESIDENARRVVERGRYSLGERKHRRKDGTLVDVEVSASTVLHNGREVACIVGHDVTERKRAEEEIKRERDFSSAITDTVGALVGVFDSEGRIVRFNRACERLSGYTFEEVRGRYFWELFLLPEEVESVKDVMEKITAGQFPNSNENYWVVRDGSLRLISWHNSALLDERGEIAYVIATGIDITERKRAEEAVKESEERYRRLVELSPDSIIVHGGGEILFVNTAGVELFGAASSEELIGKPIMDLIHPDDREIVKARIAWMRRTGERADAFQGKILRLDGRAVDVEAASTPITYQGEAATQSILRDITERKRAEDALAQSEERYRAVVEQAAEGIFLFDAATGDVLESNAAFGELLGYTVAELLDMKVYDFVAHDRESIDTNIRRILDAGSRFVGERRYRRKDGSLTDAAVSANLISYDGREVICSVVRDVTERKRAERALRESQRALATLMSNLPGMAYRCRNDPDWTMELVSEGCLELTGYSPADLIGNRRRAFGDLIHPDDRDEVWESVQAALHERLPFQLTYRITTASGEPRWIWEQGRGVFSPEGGLLALEGFVTDATDRIRAFQMLEERLTALAGISASLTVDQTMEATLDALAAGVVQSTAAVACVVVLMDEEADLLRTAGSHGLPEGYTTSLEAAYRAGMRSRSMEVFRTRRPMLFRDARQASLNNPLASPLHGFLREAPWDTIYIVPLVSRRRALGILNLYYLPGQEPGEDETVFLKAAADQTAVAMENAQLFTAAHGKAALEERQRLARELHDSVSQALYGIALGSRTAHALLDRQDSPERVAEWLEYVLSLAEAGLTEMRSLIFELRPESLETEGLIAALKQQTAALEARHEIPVRATLLGEEPDLPLEIKEALYRIAQEALHNTVKHARASRADLKLECGARGIALEVSDDGAGFDPDGDFSGHLGLKSMRERAARLGGTFRVESVPGVGTTIRVRIPPVE